MKKEDVEKSNSINDFSDNKRSRTIWVAVVICLLWLGLIGLWASVRTRADEGLGQGWQDHQVGESGTTLETGMEEDSETSAASDPTVWRPCPWDGEGSVTVTESETASASDPTKDPTADGGGSGDGETDQKTPKEEMIYHSRPNDRMEIALSFDDGPHPRLTPIILSILEEYGIKATFFMVGENVGYYPAAARAVAEAGHEIGNHTFSHRKFDRLNEEDLRWEIFSCEEAISTVSDVPVRFIRPPEGQMSDSMRRVIGELDYRVILWDVDTRDWAHTSPEDICRHILDTVQAGDIILMHDFIGYNSPTPAALRLVIPALLERGFHFVTVGALVEAD